MEMHPDEEQWSPPEYFYDTRPQDERDETAPGRLILGRDAAEPLLSDYGDAIKPLGELLSQEHFPYVNGQFGSERFTNWTFDDYRQLGNMAINAIRAVAAEDDTLTLRTEHLRRLHVLQLGPYPSSMRYADVAMWQLRESLQLPDEQLTNKFDRWTTDDFVRHAEHVADKVGRRPRRDDYDAHPGPSAAMIDRKLGYSELNELIGYPNVRRWDETDYVMWGVRVLRANGSHKLDSHVLNLLASHERGPSAPAISAKFGSLQEFRQQVAQEFERVQLKETTLLEVYEAARNTLGPVVPDTDDRTTQLHFVQRYILTRQLLPSNLEPISAARTASKPGQLYKLLQQRGLPVSQADVEATAATLDIAEFDIRPEDERWREWLYIDEAELDTRRADRRAINRATWHAAHSSS